MTKTDHFFRGETDCGHITGALYFSECLSNLVSYRGLNLLDVLTLPDEADPDQFWFVYESQDFLDRDRRDSTQDHWFAIITKEQL